MKTIIRLTESDLHRIIKESVKTALNEYAIDDLNGNPFSAHGNDPNAWDKVAALRAKRSMDSFARSLDADDPVMKDLYNDDADLHGVEADRDRRNAEELRNAIGDEYDDEYLRKFMTPYNPDDEEMLVDMDGNSDSPNDFPMLSDERYKK